MISRRLSLTLFAIVLAPGLLRAQQRYYPLVGVMGLEAPANNDKMYENIEILRRILDRKLQGLYRIHTSVTFGMVGMQGGMGSMNSGMMGMGGGIGGMQGGMGMASGSTSPSAAE